MDNQLLFDHITRERKDQTIVNRWHKVYGWRTYMYCSARKGYPLFFFREFIIDKIKTDDEYEMAMSRLWHVVKRNEDLESTS